MYLADFLEIKRQDTYKTLITTLKKKAETEDNTDKEMDVSEIKKELTNLKRTTQAQEDEMNDKEHVIVELDSEMNKQRRKIEDLKEEIAELERQYKDLEKDES